MSVFNLFSNSAKFFSDNIAISCDGKTLTYKELAKQVNQLAYYLQVQNIDTNQPIIILLERSINCYITMLAVIKLGGTYVPIETDYPDERINLILDDVDYSLLITSDRQCKRTTLKLDYKKILNINQEQIKISKTQVPDNAESCVIDLEKTCYIIYTSGSTGRPKGVEVSYKNLLHYINSAQKLYKITHTDIIYQGFSLAFDASLEEIWMSFANGAQLVVATDKSLRAGLDLHVFLNNNKVTVLSTVPSLLNNINEAVPSLRILILGGEICTPKIINKWQRKNLQIFNTYGPTETTVVATALECKANCEITIGKPLDGYKVLIVDENNNPTSEIGELCIGGPSVAKGYLNRPELTQQKFIKDPQGGEEIYYKTGDKAEINLNNEIKFHGRIDDQVKIRGFRVELNEIEAIINQHPHIKQSIALYNIDDDKQLTVYLLYENNINPDLKTLRDFLKQNLPDYMIPNNLEIVETLPLLTNGKADKKKLPKPSRNNEKIDYVAPSNKLEQLVAKIWQDIFKIEKISTNANFFYDLGGNSLLAAKAISEMRNIAEFRQLSMVDIYDTPNIIDISKKFITNKTETNSPKDQKSNAYIVPGWKHKLCTVAQFFGCILNYSLFSWEILLFYGFYSWISKLNLSPALSIFTTLILSVLVSPLMETFINVASKWLLVGKIKPGKHKLWGFYYFRWWLYLRISQTRNVAAMLVGTPLISIYYRLLGAKIAKNCFIATSNIYAPDLLTIGANTSIGTKTLLNGYAIEDGWLIIHPINIGKNCFIGSECFLGKNTVMEDGSYLEHMSSIPDFTSLSAKEFYAGSPCQKITPPADHLINQIINLPKAKQTSQKRFKYSIYHLCGLLVLTFLNMFIYIPIVLGVDYVISNHYYAWILVFALICPMITIPAYLLIMFLLKKLVLKNVKSGIHSIYSTNYVKQWFITEMLNSSQIFLLGDTMFLPIYLRGLGAKIGKNVEIGDTDEFYPDFMEFDDESFAASGALFGEPSVYQGWVKYHRSKIGKRGFIGNSSILPSGDIIGNNSLLGCVSITPYNKQSANPKTYWLGSPALMLPRREIQEQFSDEVKFKPAKNLKFKRLIIEFLRVILPTSLNTISIFAFYLGFTWLNNHHKLSYLIIGLPILVIASCLGMVLLFIAIKWLINGRLTPTTKPLWSSFIWKNDIVSYWGDVMVIPLYLNFTLGSPFANIFFRAIGSKIGKKVLIESCPILENDLITIGDYACLNNGAHLLTHLFEDRIFKISTINVGDNCTLGTKSVILYDTVMQNNSKLCSKSLLMKGETLPANTCWEGIPAQFKAENTELPNLPVNSKLKQAAKSNPEYGFINEPADIFKE